MCMHFRSCSAVSSRKKSARRDIALVVHLYKGTGENSNLVSTGLCSADWQIKNDLRRNIALAVHLYMGIGENSTSFECI